MAKMFHVKKRQKDDWVVVPRRELKSNGDLKKDARPVSQNHRSSNSARKEAEKLEAKFGVS